MNKTKTSQELHVQSVKLRQEAYDKNQEALKVEQELKAKRGKTMFKALRKAGYFDKRFNKLDNLGLDLKDPNPKSAYMVIVQDPITDYSKDVKNITIPASWVFSDNNSFLKEVKVIVDEKKRKERIRKKIRKLHKQL